MKLKQFILFIWIFVIGTSLNLFYYCKIEHIKKETIVLTNLISSLENFFKKYKSIESEIDKFQKFYQTMVHIQKQIEKLVIKATNEADFVVKLAKHATVCNVELSEIRFHRTKKKSGIYVLRLEIPVRGTYSNIKKFINTLENFNKLIIIDGILNVNTFKYNELELNLGVTLFLKS